MRKDAAAATFFARIFYCLIHVFILLICFTYENDIKSSCDTNSFWCYSFMILKLLAVFLFFTIAQKKNFVENSIELPPTNWNRPLQSYCEICNIIQGYRTYHCKKCEKCIASYDHHCFWVGSCIGELNHFRFFLYLFIESCCIWIIFFSGFSGLIKGTEGHMAFMFILALTVVFGIFLSCLCIFHCYLICDGRTTWEIIARDKISYLRPYPKNINPFTEGCWNNWIMTVCSKERYIWNLPQPLYNYPFNCFDNQYWSCC